MKRSCRTGSHLCWLALWQTPALEKVPNLKPICLYHLFGKWGQSELSMGQGNGLSSDKRWHWVLLGNLKSESEEVVSWLTSAPCALFIFVLLKKPMYFEPVWNLKSVRRGPSHFFAPFCVDWPPGEPAVPSCFGVSDRSSPSCPSPLFLELDSLVCCCCFLAMLALRSTMVFLHVFYWFFKKQNTLSHTEGKNKKQKPSRVCWPLYCTVQSPGC